MRASPRRRIGLLGGSFNPAHDGHRHISLEALKRLALDEVWWLVSPQNPLKPKAGMADLGDRLAGATAAKRHRRIRVTDLESRLGTVYTADTLGRLRRLFPRVRFVWLMGADNLGQLGRWRAWSRIFHTLPIAVFARPTYCLRATNAVAARRFHRHRWAERSGRILADSRPPGWVFLHGRLHPGSATALRSKPAGP